jgi:tetratricopeptide (TPR) repeat protein
MSVRLTILIIVSLIAGLPVSGQTTKKDSLPAKDNKTVREKIDVFLQLSEETKTVDLQQAISYAKQALQLASNTNSDEIKAKTNEKLAALYQMNNNFQPAINYYLISAKLYKSLGDKTKLANVYEFLGRLYYTDNFSLESALQYYQDALDLAMELNDQQLIAKTYNNIGGVFFEQKNYDEAHHYYKEALAIWERISNERGIGVALNNIGEIYRMKGKYSTALEYYQQSLTLSKKTDFKILIANNYENIGLVQSKLGNINEAFTYYHKALRLFEEVNETENRVDLMLTIGKEYLKINNVEQAISFFRTAYNIAISSDHWEHIAEAAYGLSLVYEKMKNYKSAYKYAKIYSSYNDSIVRKEKTISISELKKQFKIDLQEKELALAKNEITLYENEKKLSTLKLNLAILIIFMIIVISSFAIYRFLTKAKKERLIREKDAQLHQAQKELMEIEIKTKTNDLTSFALHLIQKNDLLHQLQQELKKLPCNTDEETAKTLSTLNSNIRQNLSLKEDLEEFQHKLDYAYDDFFRRLRTKHPRLTKNEERLCAFLRLNLSSKEIAAINNTSLKAAEMSRYRLRKKLGLSNNELLPEYLHNL